MAENNDENLLDQERALRAVKAIGPGDPDSEKPAETFIRSCVDFLRGWQKTHKEDARHKQVSPALFLYAPSTLPEAVRSTAIKKPAFKNACVLHLASNVFVCNENLKVVYQESHSFSDESAPLAFVDKENLRDCTGVVFLPQQDAILIHLGGEDPNDAVRFSLGAVMSEPFTFAQLDDYLTRFYKTHVETHNCYCDIWDIAGKRRLKHFAERQIQRSLAGFFDFTVGRYGVVTDQEIFTREGRSDVRLLRYRNKVDYEQAILELKVLFPDKSDSDNISWAIEGIGQIERYRKDRESQTNGCYLCCYDARKTDTDLPSVTAAAQAANIEARRYFMKTPGCGM